MFTAFETGTEKVLNLWQAKRDGLTKDDINHKTYVCKHCGESLSTKLGPIRVWHFSHKQKADCAYLREKGGESKLHRDLKQLLADTFHQKYQAHQPLVKFEERLPTIGRIADVMLDFPGGQQLVLEAQVSDITLDTLKARTLDYESLDIEVVWVFQEWEVGKKTLREVMATWLLEQGYQVMTFRTREVKELL